MPANRVPQVYETGRVIGSGSFVCVGCGFAVALEALDQLPECPSCGGSRFRRASMFEQPTVDSPRLEPEPEEPAWLREARAELPEEGQFLALEDDDDVRVVPLNEGWTRIGRSMAADLRLDDPTVSRRHALVIKTPEGDVRVLDDRSLNGVFVNGEQTDWSPLGDGDELTIGRFRLHLIDAAAHRVSV